jgi:hypothetical protein
MAPAGFSFMRIQDHIIFGRPGAGNDIADIHHPGDILNEPIESGYGYAS